MTIIRQKRPTLFVTARTVIEKRPQTRINCLEVLVPGKIFFVLLKLMMVENTRPSLLVSTRRLKEKTPQFLKYPGFAFW